MEKKEEIEKKLCKVLGRLEQLHLLLEEDLYSYSDSKFKSDKTEIRKAICELKTIHTNKKNKFSNMTDFFVMIYTSQNYNIKKTLLTLSTLDISISDKQLRNILQKEKIYRGRTDKND